MATNKINGKSYIGQTITNLKQRKYTHIYDALNNNTQCYFHRAIRKHDIKNFNWKILDRCNDIEKLNKLEEFYINFYDTFKNGYNLTTGGGNRKLSEKTKQKISISHKKENLSKEARQRMSIASRKENLSKETIQKMSIARKGRNLSEKTKKKISISRIGTKCSEKTKLKISLANKGRKLSQKIKQKMSITNKGKNARAVIIMGKYFYSILEAAKLLNISYDILYYRLNKQFSEYQYVRKPEPNICD